MGENDYTVKVTQVTSTGVRFRAIGANPARVTLLVSSSALIASQGVRAAAQPGGDPFFPLSNTQYLEFTFARHGPLVAGAWDVDTTAVGNVIFFTEILVLPK